MLPRLPLLLLLLLALLRLPGLAQPAAWQKVALDPTATQEFPDSANQRQKGVLRIYTCHSDSTVYMVMAKPTNSFVGFISHNNAQFYDGMVKQWIQEVGGQLLQRHPFRVGAFEGVEIQFATPKKPQLPATKYTRMLMVNGTVYVLNHWSNAVPGAALAADRSRFFTSFHVNTQAADQQSGAYRLGKVLGVLVVLGGLGALIIGLIVAGILLLRRRGNSSS